MPGMQSLELDCTDLSQLIVPRLSLTVPKGKAYCCDVSIVITYLSHSSQRAESTIQSKRSNSENVLGRYLCVLLYVSIFQR